MESFHAPDAAQQRDDALAALPILLDSARQVIVAAFETGDPEVEGLRALLEECVVGAHRLVLRERTRPPDAPSPSER